MYCSTFCSSSHSRGASTTGPVCPPTSRTNSIHSPNGTTGHRVEGPGRAPLGAVQQPGRKIPYVDHRRRQLRRVRHQQRLLGRPRRASHPRTAPVLLSPGPPISPARAITSRSPTAAADASSQATLASPYSSRSATSDSVPRATAPTRPHPVRRTSRTRCRTTRRSSVSPLHASSAPRTNPAATTPRTLHPTVIRYYGVRVGRLRSVAISVAPSATAPLSPRARQVTA